MLDMGSDHATALATLREAVSSYEAYRESVRRGTLLVNADDDADDVVEAARQHVGECIRACGRSGYPTEKSNRS